MGPLAVLLLSLAQQAVPQERPSVLFFMLDDVGFQDIIPNDATPKIDTPTIDGLANNGITFRRAYAQPVCETARFALMFGKYGETAGSVCFGPDADTPDTNSASLPRVFKAANYATGFFGKWHLGSNFVGVPWQRSPELHGFDHVGAGVPSNLGADACGEGFAGDYNNWIRFENGASYLDHHYNTIAIRNQFVLWWVRTTGPKFAYVSFQAAHAPFHDPPAELVPHPPLGGPGYSESRLEFEKMVMSVDTVIEQLIAVLDLSNTYIIVMGDNGTPPSATGPGQDHNKLKGTPYEGGVRVPLILVGPTIPRGIVSDSLVSIVDLTATFADLLDVPLSFQDGVSFKRVLRDPLAKPRDQVFIHHVAETLTGIQRQRAVIQERFKLIRLGGRENFYDLWADPAEEHPLSPAALAEPVVESLRTTMSDYISRGF